MASIPGFAAAWLTSLLGGCSAGGPVPSGPSSAADGIIAEASDEDERRGLIQARDDIDDEMRRIVAGQNAEIEKLRGENEALRARLKK